MTRLDEMVRDHARRRAHDQHARATRSSPSNNISNAGGMFVILAPFEDRIAATGSPRAGRGREAARSSSGTSRRRWSSRSARRRSTGLGNTGGFKLQVQDRADAGPAALQGAIETPRSRAVLRSPELRRPLQHVPRGAAAALPRRRPREGEGARRRRWTTSFSTLQIYLGSSYANDFTRFGRNWQVNVQADAAYRVDPDDIGQLKVRNRDGAMVPLSTLVSRPRHDRPRDREPLQHVPVGRDRRRHRRRASARARRSRIMEAAGATASCRRR